LGSKNGPTNLKWFTFANGVLYVADSGNGEIYQVQVGL